MADVSKAQAVEKWRALFPEGMSSDAIYTNLKNCGHDDDKIQASISRIWEDIASSPQVQENDTWEESSSASKKNKKKSTATNNNTNGKGKGGKGKGKGDGKGTYTRPEGKGKGDGKGKGEGKGKGVEGKGKGGKDGGKGRGRTAPPGNASDTKPRGTGNTTAARGAVEAASTVVVTETKTSTWASTTTAAVGGGWATDAVKTEEIEKTVIVESDAGLTLNTESSASIATSSTNAPSSVSAWSRGSASIIKAAQPAPLPTPPPSLPIPEMQMPSSVNVNSLLDEDDDLSAIMVNNTKTSVLPSSSDLSMTLESIAPVETNKKQTNQDNEAHGSNSNNSSVPSSPARGEVAPTLRLGKYGTTPSIGADSEFAFNFGSFGDAIDNTWSTGPTGSGTGGWGDAPSTEVESSLDSGNNNTSSSNKGGNKKSNKHKTHSSNDNGINGGVRGFFESEASSSSENGMSSMNGPPGLSAPKLELDQMKTVEELEAEQKLAASSSTSASSSSSSNNGSNNVTSSSSKPSAPPGMSDPSPDSQKNNHQHQNQHQGEGNSGQKPNKKHNGRRNQNNQHNQDKNMAGMMHHPGYGPPGGMYGYGMDPAMYGYPNMMMPGQQMQPPMLAQPTPVEGGVTGTGRSGLVDEGVNKDGQASPNSASRPTLGYGGGMGMPGYMPGGFAAPPQNPYFYGGGYPAGYMVPQYPQHNNMDPNFYGMMDGYGQPGQQFGKGGKGDKEGSSERPNNRRNNRNSNNNNGDASPTNAGAQYGNYPQAQGTPEQMQLWQQQQQQAFHMMQQQQAGAQGGAQNYYQQSNAGGQGNWHG